MNRSLARFVLMYYVNLFDLLHRLGLNPREHGNMMCPFHHNVHTPSAKLYNDKYGWVLFCFNEKRIYTTMDVYERILKIDPIEAANVIWNKLTVEQQDYIRQLCGNQEDFDGDVPFLEDLDKFSRNEMSYTQLCQMIAYKL